MPGVISLGRDYKVPAYCHECGKPYPWTEAILKAAEDLIELEYGVSTNERQALKQELPSLLNDTPRTKVAIVRTQSFLRKASKEVGSAFRDILVDIASEAVKKSLFPNT